MAVAGKADRNCMLATNLLITGHIDLYVGTEEGNAGMKWFVFQVALALAGTVWADEVSHDFNSLYNGPIDGQTGWNVYDKVRDSSALSVADELGTTEAVSDKALVVKASEEPIRCVIDRPIRWKTGLTLYTEFDFRVAIPSGKVAEATPAMIFYVGNPLLNEKGRWEMRLEATPNDAWMLTAAMPVKNRQEIPAFKLLVRSDDADSVSDWFHCIVEIKKMPVPDTFKTEIKIFDQSNRQIAELSCGGKGDSRVTKSMWNMTRLYAGFGAPRDLLGVACIDNLKMSYDAP